MTWLVTGSEGALGRSVVRQLDRLEIPIRTFDRVPSDRPGHVTGSIPNPATVAAAVEGIEAVIHLAAIPSDGCGTPEQIIETNVHGTMALADQAVRSGCTRFVYASSINALGVTGVGRPDRLPVDADQVAHPATPYQISKHLAEQYLLYLQRASALEVIILRPTYIIGADIYRALSDPSFVGLSRAGSELYGYVDVDDCAEAFILAAQSSQSHPGPYLVAATDTCSPVPTRQLISDWGIPLRADFEASLTADPHRSLIDSTPAIEALGWRPTTHWYSASV